MRIASIHHNPVHLEKQFGRRRALGDMRRLYGGTIERVPGVDWLARVRSEKMLVDASGVEVYTYANTYKKPHGAQVQFAGLDQLSGAVRWTALQAYRAKGGAPLTRLVTEVDGRRGCEEWVAREFITQSEIDDENLVEFLPEEAPFMATTHPVIARSGQASYETDVTEFYANGEDLLAAAHTMAKGYGELSYHSDDPDVAVAQALGAQSLEHLTEVWNEASSQKTPLAAGQFMLRALTERDS